MAIEKSCEASTGLLFAQFGVKHPLGYQALSLEQRCPYHDCVCLPVLCERPALYSCFSAEFRDFLQLYGCC